MRAVRLHAPGDSDVLRVEDVPDPTPGPGEAVVRVRAAGVNFIDIYHRRGLYPLPLPATLGMEGAGEVEAVAPDVADLRPGDRVAWSGVLGSYAERIAVPAAKLVPVPAGLDLRLAAASLLQGMTAHALTRSTFPLGPAHTCLVHAAAGGVGLLLLQMAREAGARAIGTVSTADPSSEAEVAAFGLLSGFPANRAGAIWHYTEEGVAEGAETEGRSS